MKRNVRRLLVIVGALAALLGAGMMALLFIGRPAAPSPLPNPNGYDDLLKAGQTVAGEIDNARDLDHEELRALVEENAEALRLLRVGLARSCAVPTDVQIAKFGTVISGDLVSLKALAKVLSAEGRLAEMESRPADATRSYTDAIRLGNEMSRGGFMINRLVGIACQGVGYIPLSKLLPKLTCQEIRPAVAALEQIDAMSVSWGEVLQNEDRFARAQMGNYPNPMKLLLSLWQARSMRQGPEERHDSSSAHLRLLAVELALRSYKCDQGSAPGNLKQLVPKYLRQMPTDPFSGKPLIYRQSGTNWILYSVGPDRVDDGGKQIVRISEDIVGLGSSKPRDSKRRDKGDLLYDSRW